MSGEQFVICMPVAKSLDVVPGSIAVVCSECKAQAWLSPATAAAIDGTWKKLCLDCMNKSKRPFKIRARTNGQLIEMIKFAQRKRKPLAAGEGDEGRNDSASTSS